MLIKGGMIHTMTGQGSYVGDILIRGDRIESAGPALDLSPEEAGCILDARGMTILPGMIDAHIHDGPETDDGLLRSECAAGVTCGLIWPEQEGACTLLTSSGRQSSRIYAICPDMYSDAALHERCVRLANEGYRVCCEIHSPEVCRRILAVVHSKGVKITLAHLSGCEELLEAVAIAGCSVITGVSDKRINCPWELACRLERLGVPFALTCSYPNAKLRYLRLCGALCVRVGMERGKAMHAVTTAPAGLLGLSDAGVIRPGSRADLAIFDGDPLLLSTSHVMTLSGGKICH